MEYTMVQIDELLKYLAVFATSMIKFIGGPLLGAGSGIGFVETILLTFFGMMTSVVLFSTLLGDRFKNWLSSTIYKNQKVFSNKSRRIVRVWKSYGLQGVAFLTPILFSPIVGTLIASSFGETRKRIFIYMMVSAIFWSVLLSTIIYLIKNGGQLSA